MKKKIAILGATGSIGLNALDVIRQFPDRFEVVGLSAGKNISLLREQIIIFKPKIVTVLDESLCSQLKQEFGNGLEIISGIEGLIRTATYAQADMVVSAITGAAGLVPTMAAIKANKSVALANKESLVMAGSLVMSEARARGVDIIPVDSEHNAIFQIMLGRRKNELRKIILTASGGPFFNHAKEELEKVSPEEATAHPTWKMGKKISVDSATIMNKGLEVIEACWLFGLNPRQIEVLIHPESIVHSMVEYVDGSVMAQMSIPDMRLPIAYALAYPDRLNMNVEPLKLDQTKTLNFVRPDLNRFPALELAYEAMEHGGTMPAVLNAANEVAVGAFLKNIIRFPAITDIIKKTMSLHKPEPIKNVERVLEVDHWAREKAKILISSTNNVEL